MKNFRCIESAIDTDPMVEELRRNPEFWDKDTSRQDELDIHRKTRVIILRSIKVTAAADKRVRESFPYCITYVGRRQPAAAAFPRICSTVERFAPRSGGLLGRVAIVNPLPRCAVDRHVDAGMYYKLRSSFHIVLKSPAGSRLISGDEQAILHEGELWWLDNRLPHEAFNDSDQDRIHVIFDVLSPATLLSALYRSVRFRSAQALRLVRRGLLPKRVA